MTLDHLIQSQAAIKKIRQKIVITKLLQSVTEVYYKVHQVLQNAKVIAKWDVITAIGNSLKKKTQIKKLVVNKQRLWNK